MSQSQYEKIENTVGIRDAANGKSDGDFDYKYNGKEWQDEFGLNMYDMDFRDYDPSIGRWVVIDPIDHFGQSPYNGYDSNPVFFSDPSGATTDASNFSTWVQGVEDDWAAIDAGANPFTVFNTRINSNHKRDISERIKNRRFMNALIDALTGDLGPRGAQFVPNEFDLTDRGEFNTSLAKKIANDYGYENWEEIKAFLDVHPFIPTPKGIAFLEYEAVSSKFGGSGITKLINDYGDDVINKGFGKIITKLIGKGGGQLLSTTKIQEQEPLQNKIMRTEECIQRLVDYVFRKPGEFQKPSMLNNMQNWKTHSSIFDRYMFRFY
ncbi:MAG: hypothetical protein PSV16_00740 [Flavobacterium sp.]|nr:hypothetical protein [Flavobacterium sp.]